MINTSKISTRSDQLLYNKISTRTAKDFGTYIKNATTGYDRHVELATNDAVACLSFTAFLGQRFVEEGCQEEFQKIKHVIEMFCIGFDSWHEFLMFNHNFCQNIEVSEDFFMEIIRHIGEMSSEIRKYFPSIIADKVAMNLS